MKRSSVEMNRSFFRLLFLVLILIGLANAIPTLFELVGFSERVAKFSSVTLWVFVIGTSLKSLIYFTHLKNYKEYKDKVEMKIEKLQLKLKS